MFSNLCKKFTGLNLRGDREGEGFPLFPNLPPELRTMIWRHAIGEPRLIFILQGVPGAGPFARFYSVVMNRTHLAETSQPSGVLSTCHESRHEALSGAQRNISSLKWLRMLGILEFHPTAADLVYIGGLRDLGKTPPADTGRIIPLCLVLGNILPRVCVNGDVFASYFARGNQTGEDQPPENPVEKGLASLRALNPQFAPLFTGDKRGGLPNPRLPGSMVFMLDNYPLRWGIASPCTNPDHNLVCSLSCCVHYDHLEIIPDGDMDMWIDSNRAQYDGEEAARIREILSSIRAIWAGWGRSGAVEQVPRLFFASIRTSWEAIYREDLVLGNSEQEDQEVV